MVLNRRALLLTLLILIMFAFFMWELIALWEKLDMMGIPIPEYGPAPEDVASLLREAKDITKGAAEGNA